MSLTLTRAILHALALYGATVASTAALAQADTSPIIAFRPTRSLSATEVYQFESAISTQVAPIRVPRQSMDLPSLVAQYCGSSTPERLAKAEALNPNWPQQEEIKLPPCLYWKPTAELPLALHAGGLRMARTSNAMLQNPMDKMRAGDPVKLANVTLESARLSFRPGATPEALAGAVSGFGVRVASSQPLDGLAVELRSTAVPVPLVTELHDTDKLRCQERPDWPLIAAEVRDVLQRYQDHQTDNGSPGIVVVADTGLPATDVGRLPLYITSSPNGDETWGFYTSLNSDGDPLLNAFAPNASSYPEANHGLAVASVAAGMHVFGDDLPDSRWVRLRIHSVLRRTQVLVNGHYIDGVEADSGAFAQSLKHAPADIGLSRRIPIYNVSWSFPREDAFFRETLASTSALVVVAAGNDGELNLDHQASYPASYSDQSNVISVAATGLDRRKILRSAYGRNKVTLAAPGCAIPIMTSPGRSVAHGTSLAAPLVSFAAAVIHSLGVSTASKIKERLIATSERGGEELATYLANDAVLDLPNALAVGHDVIRSPSYTGRALLKGMPNVTTLGSPVDWGRITRLEVSPQADGTWRGTVRYRMPDKDMWVEGPAAVEGLDHLTFSTWEGEQRVLGREKIVIAPRSRKIAKLMM